MAASCLAFALLHAGLIGFPAEHGMPAPPATVSGPTSASLTLPREQRQRPILDALPYLVSLVLDQVDSSLPMAHRSETLLMLTEAGETDGLSSVRPHATIAEYSLSLLRPGTMQALLSVMLISWAAQLQLPRLLDAGARIASKVVHRGEYHRLVTSLFLHADPIHLFKMCAFGIFRLVPPATAIFGPMQCLLIFVLAGMGGNAAAILLTTSNRVPSVADVPSIGASAALLGLDGALTAFELRNGLRRSTGLTVAVRRGLLTLAATSLRTPAQTARVDHAARLSELPQTRVFASHASNMPLRPSHSARFWSEVSSEVSVEVSIKR